MRAFFAASAIFFGTALVSGIASRNMFSATVRAPFWTCSKTPVAFYGASLSPLEPRNQPAVRHPGQRENNFAAQSKLPLATALSALLAALAVRSRCVSKTTRAVNANAASAAKRVQRIVNQDLVFCYPVSLHASAPPPRAAIRLSSSNADGSIMVDGFTLIAKFGLILS